MSCSIRWNFVLLWTLQFVWKTMAVRPPVCYPTKAAFEAMCTAKNGKIDGGRCFYYHAQSGDWTKGWSLCGADGGIVGQVMTMSELNLNPVHNGDATDGGALSALRDDTNPKPACSITMNTTYWYDDVATPNPMLVAANTISKYYTIENGACADKATITTPRCVGVGHYDWACDGSDAYVMCMITNAVQTFTLTDYCMIEPVIESIEPAAPSDCAQTCAQRTWCRSFNYVDTDLDAVPFTNGRCQLFCRSIYDCDVDTKKCPATVQRNETCTLYNYAK